MSWTNIPKPTGTPYTMVNPQGKEQYDQANLTYDDSTTYYDGVYTGAWTNVAKPSQGMFIFPGYATGLLTPPTYARSRDASPWIKVAKPS